ncbi:MAG: Lipoprotein releasing system, transmembrane protein, LolC/E family [uncultured Thiotrichaceae bacterium]|uniref:Lipoprotein releasing system, transmembrane protein, LolC/E family n=1 Tax=uncultured Thiotrichaceae bacterium TaxID=298394 RepID=A0A6S6UFE6_9GAMM|nr:MAG: Lipoprotein releasing system, transmembrane protein, LolC/E family [uncultured Thiotrichaceae bacterium]
MFKPTEAFIGMRYTRAKRKGAYVSFIALASMIGIAIGVMVLIVVLSIMNGFEQALRERILGMLSHVTVSTNVGELEDWQTTRDNMLQFPYVEGVAPFIDKQVMLNVDGEVRGVTLQGVLPELQTTISDLDQHMQNVSFAKLKEGEFGIILGASLARDLKVKAGDSITAISLKTASLSSGELPILKEFTVLGTFKLDMKVYDSTMGFIHIKDAAEMLDMKERVSGVRLQLEDMYKAPVLSEVIYENSSPDIWVVDWTQQFKNFFKALGMQKAMFFFILLMIIAVAAFNLISTMTMVVIDKKTDIAILRTLGLSPLGVTKTFLIQGLLTAIFGVLIGVTLGVLISSNIEVIVPLIEAIIGVPLVSEDAYFISKIKGAVQTADIVLIVVSTLLLSLFATVYPAWRASKVQPAEALRYES